MYITKIILIKIYLDTIYCCTREIFSHIIFILFLRIEFCLRASNNFYFHKFIFRSHPSNSPSLSPRSINFFDPASVALSVSIFFSTLDHRRGHWWNHSRGVSDRVGFVPSLYRRPFALLFFRSPSWTRPGSIRISYWHNMEGALVVNPRDVT